MITTIIKREILDYLKSLKFLIGLGLTVVLMTLSTVINVRDYVRRHQDYLDATKEYAADPSSHYNKVLIFRPPQTLSILAQGKDRLLGNKLEFDSMQEDVPLRPSGYLDDNERMHFRFISGFQAVDFAFMVRILMSLMVIFLAYNAVCGEKAQGTLRAALANNLPRDELLTGKFIAGVLVVFGFFLFSSALTFLVLLLNPSISLSGADMVRILGILGLSFLYLVFFFSLSLLASVVIDRPPLALMFLLQLWIVIVVLYPNLGIGLADTFYPLPEEKDLRWRKEEAVAALNMERMNLRMELYNSKNKSDETYKEKDERVKKLAQEISDKRLAIDQEYIRKTNRQVQLAQTLTILSPAVLYDSTVERLARTGIAEFERFMEGAYRTKKGYDEMWEEIKKKSHAQASRIQLCAGRDGSELPRDASGLGASSVNEPPVIRSGPDALHPKGCEVTP